MASRSRKTPSKPSVRRFGLRPLLRLVLRWTGRLVAGLALIWLALILLFAVVNPPINIYQWQESRRLGGIDREWVPLEDIAPVMARAAVAAEDANFCLHWGFDMGAIRAALDAGGARGASTISQQVVKNVFLWHGRSWVRKGLEAILTPVVEVVWSKRRILEVYLNVAEFDEGVFGVGAAASHHFGTDAASLGGRQASRLAAALPDPKGRNPARPSAFLQRRAAAILSGAETIAADGRADCFLP
jgi:monofunctional biosynthetic peptidoglycan transglycosylase